MSKSDDELILRCTMGSRLLNSYLLWTAVPKLSLRPQTGMQSYRLLGVFYARDS